MSDHLPHSSPRVISGVALADGPIAPAPARNGTPMTTLSDAEVTWFAEMFARLAANVARHIQGKDDQIGYALVALVSEGHLLLEDVPGRRQDEPGAGAGRVGVGHVEPRPVHPRPAAVRHHRRVDLQPGDAGVRVPARPDLRQHRHRRRDQPGVAEDAVGDARGDGGAAGHRRRRRPRGAPAVRRRRHAEPDRDGRRHLRPARGPARPLPPEDGDGLSRRRGRGRHRHGPPRRVARSARAGARPRRDRADDHDQLERPHRPAGRAVRGGARPRHPPHRRRAPRRQPAWLDRPAARRPDARRRRGPAVRRSPTTSSGWPCRCSPTA